MMKYYVLMAVYTSASEMIRDTVENRPHTAKFLKDKLYELFNDKEVYPFAKKTLSLEDTSRPLADIFDYLKETVRDGKFYPEDGEHYDVSKIEIVVSVEKIHDQFSEAYRATVSPDGTIQADKKSCEQFPRILMDELYGSKSSDIYQGRVDSEPDEKEEK